MSLSGFMLNSLSSAIRSLTLISTQVIEKYTYKQNYEICANTATLLIHNLKYLSLVSLCFTKGKKRARV